MTWLLLIIIALGGRPLPPADQPVYRVYLPMIATPIPLVEDRRDGPEVCMAWSPGDLVDQSVTDFGTQFFFHSDSHTATWIQRGGIPVWRSPNQPTAFINVMAELKRQNHKGLILLFNEPDIDGQDGELSPEDAAGLYRLAVRLFPGATFITPNANSVWWTQRFFAAVGDAWRPHDKIGIHMYQPPTDNINGVWQFEYPTIWPNEWLAPVYELAAELRSQIWISEAGVSNEWATNDIEQYIDQLLRSNTETICFYTPNCGGYSDHACLHDLYRNNTLTLYGAMLKAALRE